MSDTKISHIRVYDANKAPGEAMNGYIYEIRDDDAYIIPLEGNFSGVGWFSVLKPNYDAAYCVGPANANLASDGAGGEGS